MVYIKNLIQ